MWQRGFSLLELLVTLALISALIALGVPSFSSLRQRLALASAARQVTADLALARIRAIARNREQRLLFAVGTSIYQPQEKGVGFDAVGPLRELPNAVRIHDCTAPGDALAFRPRGNAASFGTVVLRSPAGETRSITLSITGRARIQ